VSAGAGGRHGRDASRAPCHRPRAAAAFGLAALLAACNSDRLAPPPGFESPLPSARIELEPGEFITFSGSELSGTVELPAAPESRSYVVAVLDARGTPGPAASIRLSVIRAGAPLATSTVTRSATPPREFASPGPDPIQDWFAHDEAAFRRSVGRDLRLAGARPATRAGAPSLRWSRSASVAAVGDTLVFGSPVEADGTLATCTSTSRVTGVVRAVGARFTVVEDTAAAGLLGAPYYSALLDEIETVAWPVDSAYFGQPFDIDANGSVIVLVTGEVNRLGAAGFFTRSDLSARADCPASNEGEVLWVVAPDPDRRFGNDVIPIGLVESRLPGVVAHELQHLIHAERRIFEAGGDFESVEVLWLNEAMSHIAEEVAGFYRGGRTTGANLDFSDLGDPEVTATFDRYHVGNLRFVQTYFRETTRVPALADEPVSRGELGRARGFGYLFLRWIADRYAADGPRGIVGPEAEQTFFRALTVGGGALLQSTENVVRTLSTTLGQTRTWQDLFAEYVTAPAVDDATPASVSLPGALIIPTWNLPAVYENAAASGFGLDFPNGFPLVPRLILLGTIPASGFVDDLELLPSTASYYRFEGVVETPASHIRITGPNGAPLPDSGDIRVTITRTL